MHPVHFRGKRPIGPVGPAGLEPGIDQLVVGLPERDRSRRTAYTTPLASLPPMWNSDGSPSLACTFVTSTGMPFAAHTLL